MAEELHDTDEQYLKQELLKVDDMDVDDLNPLQALEKKQVRFVQ